MTYLDVIEKNTYRIRRIRAYRKYFWVVKDVVKGCFLWSGGFWWGSVTFKFPLKRRDMNKAEILLRIPGYFSSKKAALLCLKKVLRNVYE